MKEKIVFMSEGDMDYRPPGAESFRLPEAKNKIELKVEDAPKSRIKDIRSRRRAQEPPETRPNKFAKVAGKEPPAKTDEKPEETRPGEETIPAPLSGEQRPGEEKMEEKDEVDAAMERGDVEGATKNLFEKVGVDPESPEAQKGTEAAKEIIAILKEDEEHRDLEKLEEAFKTIHAAPEGVKKLLRSTLGKFGIDKQEIDRLLPPKSVSPAPLEEDGGAGGEEPMAAPDGGEDEEPLPAPDEDFDKAREQAENGDVDGAQDTLKNGMKKYLDKLKKFSGKGLKHTLTAVAVAVIVAYVTEIWMLKTIGNMSDKAKGR